MTWMGLTIDAPTLRFLTFWVALESLFAPDTTSESTFKLSQNMAFFLHCDGEVALRSFKRIKYLYGKRSAVAHGRIAQLKDLGQSLIEVEDLLRRSLIKIVERPRLIDLFNSRKRASYLEELPYSPEKRLDSTELDSTASPIK